MFKKFLFYFSKYNFLDKSNRNFGYTRFRLNGKVKLFNKIFYYHYGLAFKNTYDEIFVEGIYNFKSTNKNPLIIDCGANMGLSVLFFSKSMPNSDIIAFEPDKSVLPFLKKNLKSQNLNNVTLHEKAVWINEDELSFYTDNGLGGRIGQEYANRKPTKISTVRLKDFLNQRVDMLKIDIEGAEYKVLKDCEDSLSKVSNIFVEYHSNFNEIQELDDILKILKNAGFRYHLKESFSRNKPFVDKKIICQQFDMAINIFAYRDHEYSR